MTLGIQASQPNSSASIEATNIDFLLLSAISEETDSAYSSSCAPTAAEFSPARPGLERQNVASRKGQGDEQEVTGLCGHPQLCA